MKKYNKLVRDKIPDIICRRGEVAICHVADSKEYQKMLDKKVLEEFREFRKNRSIDELADLAEVLRAIANQRDWSWEEVEKMRRAKKRQRGGYRKRIILEKS